MIVIWGSVNADLIFPLDRLPAPGETVLGPAAWFEPGGKGANQAVAAAKDGATVAMAGAVGRDALADGALAGLLAITQGVEKSGMLQATAQRLLARVTSLRALALLLVVMAFAFYNDLNRLFTG